jgi:DNA-binding transcriptional LysR family regulator
MDLDEMRALAAVVETGSLFGAAERLGWPRATLRRRVEELEARVGVPLLVRTARGAAPTAAGALLAAKAGPLLSDVAALVRAVQEMGERPTGAVRACIPPGLPPRMLGAIFGIIRARFPDLQLDVQVATTSPEGPDKGWDLLIHFGEPVARERWVTLELMVLREWLVASPAYLARRGVPQTISELSHHDLLAWARPDVPTSRWPTLDGLEFPVRPALIHQDIHTLRHLAAAGAGIALLPDAEVPDPELPEGALATVLQNEVGRVVSLCLSCPVGSYERSRVRALVDLCRGFSRSL